IAPGNADPELQKVFSPVLPVDSSSPPVLITLNLGKLVPAGAASWSYLGGLTTPSTTCNAATRVEQLSSGIFPEIVRWYVLQNVVLLPVKSMDNFDTLVEEGNARPVHDLTVGPVFRDD